MNEEVSGVITILENDRAVAMFLAPPDSHAARTLWIFLVENLRPGLEVTLAIGGIRLRHASGQKVPIEVYSRIMDGPTGRGEA